MYDKDRLSYIPILTKSVATNTTFFFWIKTSWYFLDFFLQHRDSIRDRGQQSTSRCSMLNLYAFRIVPIVTSSITMIIQDFLACTIISKMFKEAAAVLVRGR